MPVEYDPNDPWAYLSQVAGVDAPQPDPLQNIATGGWLPWAQDSYASQAGYAVESPEWNRIWQLEQVYRNSPEIYQNQNASFFDFVAQQDPQLAQAIRNPATEAYDQRVRMQAAQGVQRYQTFQDQQNDVGLADWNVWGPPLFGAIAGGTAIGSALGAGAAGAGGGASVPGAAPLAPGAGVLAGGGLPTVGNIPLLGGGAAAGGALAPGAGVLLPGAAAAGGLAPGAGVLAPAATSAAPFGSNALAGYGVTAPASTLPAGGGVLAPAAAAPIGGAVSAGGAGAGSATLPAAAAPAAGAVAPHAEPVVQGGLGVPGWLTVGGAVAGALGSANTDDQTTTTTSGPPEYLRPYLEQAAGAAQSIYNANPGGQVVPFSPQTAEALRLTEARARAGSPVNTAAQQYGTNVLQGNYLNANPYLDATFQRAARGVTNAVQSNFGRSGRDVRGNDAAGVAAMHYGDLANQIYGGNYQAERDRMQQLVPYAGTLANQDYADYGQLAGVGAQYEALQREQQNAPGTALDQYLARLQGLPGASVTQTTPTSSNWLAGAAGGALLGRSIYDMYGG